MSYFARSDELPAWVAALPDSWGSDWLKWSVRLSTDRPSEEEQAGLPYISNEDIASWTGKLLNDEPKPAESEGRKFLIDDVLLNKLRPYLAKVYHADFDGVSSGELLCLRPSDTVMPRFLFYVLASKGFIDSIDAETFGSKMPRADWEIVGHQPLPLPPLETQRHIAQFLDEKTTRIYGLIEKKRALLNRLAEKRQALITRAVTKGLNPDAPMKPSGIDWLGEIPAHWEVMPIKRSIVQIEQGWSPAAEARTASLEEWGVLKSGCVNDGVFDENSHKALPAGIDPKPELEVRAGDILMCRASGSLRFIGSVALVAEVRPNLIFSDKTYRIFLDSQKVDKYYFVYSMAAKHMREQVVLSVSGAEGLANNIAQSSVGSYLHSFPPLSEQKAIAEYLEHTTHQLERLKTSIEKSVRRLNEYRSSLITTAVTGQIEGLA
jgi:type I restriction enzyme S subunit